MKVWTMIFPASVGLGMLREDNTGAEPTAEQPLGVDTEKKEIQIYEVMYPKRFNTAGEADPGALLPQARFGNVLATFLIRLLYGSRYNDLGLFRAVRCPALLRLEMTDRTYGWTVEMQIQAIRQGLRITEVPVRYWKRAGGTSRVSGAIKGTVLAGYKILWTVFRYTWRMV
jgi:hypothetical protein